MHLLHNYNYEQYSTNVFIAQSEINATLFFFEFSQFWGHGHLGCGVRMIDACKDTVTRPRKG